jgi:hypothetical protein
LTKAPNKEKFLALVEPDDGKTLAAIKYRINQRNMTTEVKGTAFINGATYEITGNISPDGKTLSDLQSLGMLYKGETTDNPRIAALAKMLDIPTEDIEDNDDFDLSTKSANYYVMTAEERDELFAEKLDELIEDFCIADEAMAFFDMEGFKASKTPAKLLAEDGIEVQEGEYFIYVESFIVSQKMRNRWA